MTNANPHPEPPSRLRRWICWITGTDPELLAVCPQRDRDHVTTIALIQITVFIWQTLVFALAAHLMLAKPGEFHPELIGVALLLAMIIGLIDAYMIIRSSWYLHGMEELRRAGLIIPGSISARVQNALYVAIRFCMASASSFLISGVIAILIFAKDVERRLDAVYQLANSQLIQIARDEYDQTTRALESGRAPLEAQLAKDAEMTGQAGLTGAIAAPEKERFREAAARVAELEHGRSVAENDLREAQSFATDELGGVRRNARNSGIPGRGPLRLAAEERRRQSEERLRGTGKDLAAERKHLDDLRRSAAIEARQLSELAAPKLASLETARRQHAQELAALDARLIERQSARASAIQAAIERDPAYRPREDGLLARARALATVAAEDPWAKSLIIALGGFLFIVELAAVVAKSFTFVPSAYASMLAQQESERARKISRRIAEDFNLLADRRLGTHPDRDIPVDKPVNGDAQADVQDPSSRGISLPAAAEQTPVPQSRPRGRPPRQPRALPDGHEPGIEPTQAPPRNGDNLFDSGV